MKKYILSIMLFVFMFSTIYAQKENVAVSLSNNIIIKLVTIGPGHELTSWWGHTAIIVEDLDAGESKFYNYRRYCFY